jgi:hypothetical protein
MACGSTWSRATEWSAAPGLPAASAWIEFVALIEAASRHSTRSSDWTACRPSGARNGVASSTWIPGCGPSLLACQTFSPQSKTYPKLL